MSDVNKLEHFSVIEPDVNLSNHKPSSAKFSACILICENCEVLSRPTNNNVAKPTQLRWDYVDLVLYYQLTGIYVQQILRNLDHCNCTDNERRSIGYLNSIYDKVVDTLDY